MAAHAANPRWRLTLIAGVMSMLAPFSIDTYLPSFPSIAAELGASEVQLQQTLSLYMLAFGVMTLVYGPLSDAFGRRRIAGWAALAYVVASIGCALAPGIGALIALRIAQGLVAGAGMVIARAMVRDVYAGPDAQRVLANVMLTLSVAPALAPIVGGVLQALAGWRSVFWFLAAFGACLWLMLTFGLRETLPSDARRRVHPGQIVRDYLGALKDMRLVPLIGAIALAFAGLFVNIAASPVVLFGPLGLDETEFGLLYVPLVAGLMTGSFTNGRLAGRLSPAGTVAVGYSVMALASAGALASATFLPPSPLTYVPPIAIYCMGMAMAMPNLALRALDLYPDRRGMVSAVQQALQTSAGALMAGAVAPWVAGDLRMLAGVTLAAMTVSALLGLWGMGVVAGGGAPAWPGGELREGAEE